MSLDDHQSGALIQVAIIIREFMRTHPSTTLGDFEQYGFPNQFFCDSWVVGFWRADHEEHIIGLGSRACTVAEAVRGPVRAQGAAGGVPALRDGVDWTWRSQECSADGGAACARRL